MDFGFAILGRGPLSDPDSLVKVVQQGENLGYDAVYIGDHILVPKEVSAPYPYSPDGSWGGVATGEVKEQLTTLAFLAGATSRLRLVASVMIVPYRPPLLAAKVVTTIDVLSKGRLTLGVGAGWMREEFDALRIQPFEKRGDVTDDYIKAFKAMWGESNPTYHGEYCDISGIQFLPKPVQTPHPPIWVGGESPRAIRRAATFGDAWYPFGSNPAFPLDTPKRLRTSIERLRVQMDKQNRDPATTDVAYRPAHYNYTSKGHSAPFVGNAEQIVEDIAEFNALGVNHLVIGFNENSVEEQLFDLEQFATEVMPKARNL